MRPKLKEESYEIDKMSIAMLNYYQDAEAHIDELEEFITHKVGCDKYIGEWEDEIPPLCTCGFDKLIKH